MQKVEYRGSICREACDDRVGKFWIQGLIAMIQKVARRSLSKSAPGHEGRGWASLSESWSKGPTLFACVGQPQTTTTSSSTSCTRVPQVVERRKKKEEAGQDHGGQVPGKADLFDLEQKWQTAFPCVSARLSLSWDLLPPSLSWRWTGMAGWSLCT